MSEISKSEHHAIAHARVKVADATDDNPECCFDYELVQDLLRVIDRHIILPDLIKGVSRPEVRSESARAEDIAIELCLSYGRDPDEPTSIMEMCDGDNQPVPTWMVYAEQAEALLAKFDIRRAGGAAQAPRDEDQEYAKTMRDVAYVLRAEALDGLVDWSKPIETAPNNNGDLPRRAKVIGSHRGAVDYIDVLIYGEDYHHPAGKYAAEKTSGQIRGNLHIRNATSPLTSMDSNYFVRLIASFPLEDSNQLKSNDDVIYGFNDWRLTVGDVNAARLASPVPSQDGKSHD